MKTSKRFLTLLLVLTLLVGIFTISASATEDAETEYDFTVTGRGVTAYIDGDYITLDFTVPGNKPGKEFLGWALTEESTVATFSAVTQTLTLENFASIVGKTAGTVVLYPIWEETDDDFDWDWDWDYDWDHDCDRPIIGKEYNLYVGAYVINNYWNWDYNCGHKYNCDCDDWYDFECEKHWYDCDCDDFWLNDSWWFDSSWDETDFWAECYFDSDSDFYGEFAAGKKVRISAPTPTAPYGMKYEFVGWRNAESNRKNGYFADKDSKYTTYTMPAADATIYAVYELVGAGYSKCNSHHVHKITFTDGVPGETVFRDIVKNVRNGATIPTVKDPVRKGYRFGGWSPKVPAKATECAVYEAKWISEKAPALTTEHVAYLKGYGKGYVRPEGNITRAEFATMLYRLMDVKSSKEYYASNNTFADVANDAWYNVAVSTLANAGVIETANGGNFYPNKAITRAEVVSMIAAFYQTGKDYTCKFNDVSTSHPYYDEIAQAVSMGWIKGYGGNTFMPDATITRAEVSAIMNRVLDRTDCNTKDTKNYVDNPVNAWYYQDIVEASIAH